MAVYECITRSVEGGQAGSQALIRGPQNNVMVQDLVAVCVREEFQSIQSSCVVHVLTVLEFWLVQVQSKNNVWPS